MNNDYLYNCIECRQDWAMEHLCHVCNPQEVKSFNIYNLLSEYSGGVLVPKIQRDYAQGRSEESDHGQAKLVRNDFLNYLFDNSKEEKSLDFVFGTTKQKDDKVWFIPVDGQQRLTTLWLLMLYQVKVIDTKDSQKYCESETCASLLKKFSYDNRRAARDFVKNIAEKEWDIKDRGKSDDVSYSLKICNWFMDYWQYDPTVDSMLRMLDAIHNLYKEKNCFSDLNCFPDLTNIKFYFFDMQAHGLDENLYLKMNSRGKPLTPFENLKANIEGLLEALKDAEKKPNCDNAFSNEMQSDKNIFGNTFCEKWKYYIDRDWTNWFWKNSKENNTIDKAFAQFICRFSAGYCKINYSAEDVYDKLNREENESDEDFSNRKKQLFKELIDYLLSEYKENQNIDFEKIRPALRNNAFEAMAKVLMGFSKDKYLIQPYWDRNNCDLGEKFNGSDKVKIEEYKQLAVIQSYLIADGKDDKEKNAWMRFAWNMAENYVTGAKNYISFCEMLAVLRDKNETLYEAMISPDVLGTNPPPQLKEEIEKAAQIIRKIKNQNSEGPAEDVIIQAESYAFFKGAIRFLFRDENGEINEKSWNDFDKKWKNAQEYFDGKGVKDKYKTKLIKSLVIQCANWDNQLYNKQIFNPNASTWKWIMCADEWRAAINKILVDIKNILPVQNKEHPVLKLLQYLPYETLVQKRPRGRFRCNGRLGFYEPYEQNAITFDWGNFRRNEILSALINEEKIQCTSLLDNINDHCFFEGWDVDFSYCNHTFRWHQNNYVYLMNQDPKNPNGYTYRNQNKKEELEIYCCFKAEGIDDSVEFIKQLNDLIKEHENRCSQCTDQTSEQPAEQ